MWRGSLYLGEDVLVLAGTGRSEADAHAHYAAQMTFAWGGALSTELRGETFTGACAVPGGERHQIRVDAERIVMVMAEPRAAFGHAIDETCRSLGLHEAARRLATLEAPDGRGDLTAFLTRARTALAGHARRDVPRRTAHVANALTYVRDGPAPELSLTGAATAAGVSASRLTHLFSEEMGIPFSRYVLWSRFRRVVGALAQGSSLTQAAATAGFADSAHLTRSFRRTFGIVPSALAGVELHVDGPFGEDDRSVQGVAAGAP